ncbi:pyrimidine utilization protein D [Jejubacter calystegiae]|uniref:Putative carbamate hydrolase RutD n=1 Tax=Jejubacter calystegiae TaxID=2579935 RepID=A0A4P8YI14_9ENTR|nr:pyrimidine utilization protein D [Jejubacter calystegiae]QCT20349.1 pyrimidine utilization protein D [Jejubacter calystegiae]
MKLNIGPAPFPDAPVLVMISGLGGTAGYWRPQQPLDQVFQLVSYDQRGTGDNPATLPDDYSLAAMAAELHQALAEARIRHYAVLGHALGGLVGLQLALDAPRSLSALIVINGWLSLSARTRRCFVLRETLLAARGAEAWIAAQPLFLYPAPWLSEHEAQLEHEARQQARHFKGVHNLNRRLQALKAADFRELVATIQQPALIVGARDDLLVPWQCSQELHAALPHSQLEIVDQGAHACNITQSATINALIRTWLSRHMAPHLSISGEML